MKHYGISNSLAGSHSNWELNIVRNTLDYTPGLENKIVVTNSVPLLENILWEHRDFRPDILSIIGGDGTASKTATAVKKVWGYLPEIIMLLPTGTVCQLAAALGVSDGLYDKAKKVIHQGTTKAIQSVQYVSVCIQNGQKLNTERVPILDINGQQGFNFGAVIVPKLLWTYYGKSMQQYKNLEETLEQAQPDKYEWELQKSWDQQNLLSSFIEFVSNGNETLLKRTGAAYALAAAALSISSTFNPFSDLDDFYMESFDGEIYLDGELHRPSRPINGIYVSTYEQFNLGVKALTFHPTPDARSHPGRMELGLCSESALGLVSQLPKLKTGQPLSGIHYAFPEEVVLKSRKPIIYQIDGDFAIADEVTIRYDQELNIVSPYQKQPELKVVTP